MPLVLPILHPAAILQGMEVEDAAQVVYLKRANAYVRNLHVPALAPDGPPQGSHIRPSLRTLERFGQDIENTKVTWPHQKPGLCLDIENAGDYITLIGLDLLDMNSERVVSSLSLPVRTQGGVNYWSTWDEHEAAVGHLYRWLADTRVDKIFHNGISHDVPQLERVGFVVGGDLFDTLVMQHYCYPEMRKALQYCATLYCGAPVWKTLGDDEETE